MYQQTQYGQQQTISTGMEAAMNEQDWGNAVLSELKRTASEYATAALEASNPAIRQTFASLSQRTIQDQAELYQTLKQLGGYGSVQMAQAQELQQELQSQKQKAGELQAIVQQCTQGAGTNQNQIQGQSYISAASTPAQTSHGYGQQQFAYSGMGTSGNAAAGSGGYSGQYSSAGIGFSGQNNGMNSYSSNTSSGYAGNAISNASNGYTGNASNNTISGYAGSVSSNTGSDYTGSVSSNLSSGYAGSVSSNTSSGYAGNASNNTSSDYTGQAGNMNNAYSAGGAYASQTKSAAMGQNYGYFSSMNQEEDREAASVPTALKSGTVLTEMAEPVHKSSNSGTDAGMSSSSSTTAYGAASANKMENREQSTLSSAAQTDNNSTYAFSASEGHGSRSLSSTRSKYFM